MTTQENLLMGAYSRKDRKKITQDLDQYFTLFPILKERRNQEAKTLSGGEQQMLAIARGLLTRPKLMLFDEPSLGLAPLIIKEVFEIIQNLQKMGSTILLVEQNATMALKTAHYAYLLEKGRISLEGAPDTFLANQHVIDAYLGRMAK
jgi:branched-chain amino acid transport system ATP-binding protein